MNVNIRKRRPEDALQRACSEESSPEKKSKKQRNPVMQGGEAANIIVRFWRSNPKDPNFKSLAAQTILAIQLIRRGLTDDMKAAEYTEKITQTGLLDTILFLLDVSRYFGGHLDDQTVWTLQFEAAWTLTNIASGTGAKAIIENGQVLDILGRVVVNKTAPPNVREQAIWCIANLAGYEQEAKKKGLETKGNSFNQQVLSHEQITQGLLQSILQPDNFQSLKTGLWAIGNVIHGSATPASKALVNALLQTFQTAIHDKAIGEKERFDIFSETFAALRKAMEAHLQVVEYVGKTEGFIMEMMNLLKSARVSGAGNVVYRVIRCVGLLLSFQRDTENNDSAETEDAVIEKIQNLFLQHKFLAEANHLLREQNYQILEETCRCLHWFVRRGDAVRIKKFRARGCLESMVEIASTQKYRIKKEALMTICTLVIKGDQNSHRHFFSTSVGAQLLGDCLKTKFYNDFELGRPALEAIEALLEMDRVHDGELCVPEKLAECRSHLEDLYYHHMKYIQKKSTHIVEQYFAVDENDDGDIVYEKQSGFDGLSPPHMVDVDVVRKPLFTSS